MTLPLTPGLPTQLAPPPPQPSPIDFPLTSLLENAPPPIQYRAIADVARIGGAAPEPWGLLPYSYRPALELALMQQPEGTWGDAMLAIPSGRGGLFQGVGTISAVLRLLEYGWEQQSPPLLHARRILFRLLAEDDDASYLFELAPRGRVSIEAVRHGRAILREAAAAVLARAGYEKDPRLRGAALRIMGRMDAFLRSPLAEKPFMRVGNQHVLAPEAAPPSFYSLMMLAFMPLFRSEHYGTMDRLHHYLTQPTPRAVPASVVGGKIVGEPHLVLGNPLPHRTAADADVTAALVWLELFARLDLLRRDEGWTKLFERFLDDRDASGAWRAPRRTAVLTSRNPHVWPFSPLGAGTTADERAMEVTLRLGLIARLSGRPIRLV